MTVKRRVKKLEESIGGTSAMHFLIVCAGKDESRDEALQRTLDANGITISDVGRALFFGGKRAPEDIVYREDIPANQLISELKDIIKRAGQRITLDPPQGVAA